MIRLGGVEVAAAHLVVALPAVAAVLTLLLVRRSSRGASVLTGLGALGGLATAVRLLVEQWGRDSDRLLGTFGELPTGGVLDVPLRLLVDDWSALVAAAVALVSGAVLAFSRWYLWSDPRYRQFAATVALFTAAMQLVVLSGDLLLTLVGWELMGWCSYLLIGHESQRERARRAAYKAFLVTRLADAPLVVGLAALAMGARSTHVPTVIQHWTTAPQADTLALSGAVLAIICGVLGKSAQLPFTDWLPDAMEGPTPASALIHAATMVAAGTVVLGRLLPVVQAAPYARAVLVVVAGVTMVLAALLAFAQEDLKRLLAWSTISQVGLMLVALATIPRGTGPDLAVTHLLGHAVFKALLFLMIGWISVLVGGTVVPRMSGAVRRFPQTRTLTAVGLLALAGVPPLVGFVTKELVIEEAGVQAARGSDIGLLTLVLVVVTTVLTAAYVMRAWLMLQRRTVLERRDLRTEIQDSHTVRDVGIVEMLRVAPEVDETGHLVDRTGPVVDEDEPDPEPMFLGRLGLLLLAVLSVVGGVVVLAPGLDVEAELPHGLLLAAVLLLMAAAALLVRILSLRTTYGDAAARLPLAWRSAAARGLGVDTLYAGLGNGVLALARLVRTADAGLDRGVTSLVGAAAALGDRSERVHTRRPTTGLLAVALGILLTSILGVALW